MPGASATIALQNSQGSHRLLKDFGREGGRYLGGKLSGRSLQNPRPGAKQCNELTKQQTNVAFKDRNSNWKKTSKTHLPGQGDKRLPLLTWDINHWDPSTQHALSAHTSSQAHDHDTSPAADLQTRAVTRTPPHLHKYTRRSAHPVCMAACRSQTR